MVVEEMNKELWTDLDCEEIKAEVEGEISCEPQVCPFCSNNCNINCNPYCNINTTPAGAEN